MNPLRTLAQTWKAGYSRIAGLPFLFLLIAIEVYFWVNGRAHFPDWDASYSDLILIYLGMTVIFLLWARRGTEAQMKIPIRLAVPVFVLFFIATYIILFFMSLLGLIQTQALPGELFWQTVIIQVCVVATAEELMFRGVILEFLGITASAILFALWHGWAYGIRYYDFSWEQFPLMAVMFAFVIGLLLGFIAKRKEWGLPATISIHASYNLFVIGAFYSFNIS